MNTTPRRLTARQVATALAAIDAQLANIRAALAGFDATWGECSPVPDAVGAAWNSMHDAERALTAHRAQVELNPRPVDRLSTSGLVAQNID
jgi:hypothetical protein